MRNLAILFLPLFSAFLHASDAPSGSPPVPVLMISLDPAKEGTP